MITPEQEKYIEKCIPMDEDGAMYRKSLMRLAFEHANADITAQLKLEHAEIKRHCEEIEKLRADLALRHGKEKGIIESYGE